MSAQNPQTTTSTINGYDGPLITSSDPGEFIAGRASITPTEDSVDPYAKVDLSDWFRERLEDGDLREDAYHNVRVISADDEAITASILPADCTCGECRETIIISLETLDDDTYDEVTAATQTIARIASNVYQDTLDGAPVVIIT